MIFSGNVDETVKAIMGEIRYWFNVDLSLYRGNMYDINSDKERYSLFCFDTLFNDEVGGKKLPLVVVFGSDKRDCTMAEAIHEDADALENFLRRCLMEICDDGTDLISYNICEDCLTKRNYG